MRRQSSTSLPPNKTSELVEILQLPLKERMLQEINRVYELTKNMKLFESLKKSGQPDTHLQLCHHFGVSSFRTNEVIVNIGMVGVYVRQKRKDQVQKEEQLFLVKVLKQGDWFGEVGMVYNQSSLVSYVCLEETNAATINLNVFKTLLDQFFLIRMTFQLNFLREIPLFWGWSENDLRVLYQSYSRQKYVSEEPVYLQGDQSSYIYIVKEGSFNIYKHFGELRVRKYYDQKFNQLLDDDKYHIKSIREFEEDKNLQVGTIQRNEMFGEEDILTKRNRKYSVVCEAEYGELFVFTKTAVSSLLMNNEKSKNYILARFKNKLGSYSKRLDNISQYVSSVKIDVIEKNQDQLRLTEDFLSTRSSKILEQQSMIQSMKTLSKLSDTKYGTLRQNQSGLKNSIRLDLPNLKQSQNYTFVQQQQQQQSFNHGRDTKSQLISSRGMQGYGHQSQTNLEDRNNMIISRTQVNFKSLNNLNSADNLVNTQYFQSQSQYQQPYIQGMNKAEIKEEKKRKNYMQKYYDQFQFNTVDKNYSQKIINQCQDISNMDYSQNRSYAKGSFNNKLGQRGFRCLGIDNPRDTNGDYEKAKLKIQEEFDPDYKIKNLNHSVSLKK